MKMVVEPTGCLGFAAARNLKDELKANISALLLVVAMSIFLNMQSFYLPNQTQCLSIISFKAL